MRVVCERCGGPATMTADPAAPRRLLIVCAQCPHRREVAFTWVGDRPAAADAPPN